MKIERIFKPIRVYGDQWSPVHLSPIFGVLIFVGLVLGQLFSLPFSIHTGLPQLAEWGVFSLLTVLFFFLVGLIPPFLVSVKRRMGYQWAYGALLVISLIVITGHSLNPSVNISLISTFLQTAGGIGIALPFLWCPIRYIGTHDNDANAHREWVMHNAVAALLRRNEITREEARIVNPIEINRPPLIDRLGCLGPITRQVVEREMVVEELVQANKREFGLLR